MTIEGEASAVYEMLCEEGFVKESIDLDPEAVLDYLVPIIEPVQADEFTFSRGWMRAQAARIADPRSPAHQLGKQLNLPPSYLLIHRVTLSTIGVLCQLGATVRLRDELEAWVPGFLPETVEAEFPDQATGQPADQLTEQVTEQVTGEVPEEELPPAQAHA